MGRITELCSRLVVTTWSPSASSPKMIRLRASVALYPKHSRSGHSRSPPKNFVSRLRSSVEQLPSLDREIEAAASRIHAGLAIELQHEFINVFWLGPDRRGIVEIDEMVVHALRPEGMLGLGAGRSTSRVKGIQRRRHGEIAEIEGRELTFFSGASWFARSSLRGAKALQAVSRAASLDPR